MNSLYKYRTFNKEFSLAEIKNQEIWYSHGEYLNDPFEFHKIIHELNNQYSSDEVLKWHEENLIDTETLKSIEMTMEGDIGVLSLSKYWNSKLLWSHYADSYKGFCLEFEFSDPMYKKNIIVANSSMNSTTSSVEALEVSYYPEFMIPTIKDLVESKGAFFKRIFVAKSIDWIYEGEYRILRQLGTKYRIQNEVHQISKLVHNKIDEQSKNINLICWELNDLMNQPMQSIKREDLINIANQIPKYTKNVEIIKIANQISSSAKGRLYEFPSKIKSIIFGLHTPKEHKEEIKSAILEKKLDIKLKEIFENNSYELVLREI
jgi:hypothetical protein